MKAPMEAPTDTLFIPKIQFLAIFSKTLGQIKKFHILDPPWFWILHIKTPPPGHEGPHGGPNGYPISPKVQSFAIFS